MDAILLILVRRYRHMMENAANEIKAALPRGMVNRYKNLLGYWVEEVPVLEPLYKIIKEVDGDIEKLEGKKDTKTQGK